MKIAVIGLGKLGSCHAAVMAYKGFEVVGADLNQKFVDKINSGIAPVIETGLQNLIDNCDKRLKATTKVSDAVKDSDVIFVIVPTPSDEEGRFSLNYSIDAAESIGEGLKTSTRPYPIVVMTSTVMPGDTGGKFVPAIEKFSGKKLGQHFGACYSPEFIALGSVVRDMLNPDMILIGESDKKSGDIIQSIYEKSCDNKPYFARMNFVNAELTKISVNSYVTTKISYANTLAQICSRIKGANSDTVLEAVGKDSRIGNKYLKGGLAFGGPCFPRDNIAFSKVAEDIGIDSILAKAVDSTNHYHTKFVASMVQQYANGKKKVGILGLSYKPQTPVIDVSPGIALARELLRHGLEVFAYDPMATENAKAVLSELKYCNNSKECIDNSEIIFICTAWPEFSKLKTQEISDKNLVIVDCWRILDNNEWKEYPNLVKLGVGQ